MIIAFASAGLSGYFAYRFYLERSQARLTPTFERVYAKENALLPPAAMPRVVMFGDSRIQNWQPQPSPAGYELVFRGIRGETTAQMRHRFMSDTHAIHASVVVIEAGINDLVAGIALHKGPSARDAAFRNIKAMVDLSTQNGLNVILLTVIPPASPPLIRRVVWSDSIYPLVAELNHQLRALAGPRVRLIDADRILCGSADRVPRDLARDTLHLRPQGYHALNAALSQALQELSRAFQ